MRMCRWVSYLLVYALKLPSPLDIVKELAQVESVIVRAVRFGVVGWSQGCHLVSVDGIRTEEVLHLLGHLGT